MKKAIMVTALLLALTMFTACAAPSVSPAQPSTAPAASTPEQPQASVQPSTPAEPEAPIPSEPIAEPIAADDPIVIKKLNAMMPIFDSIARSVTVEGSEYAPTDNEFFWTILYLMGANWGYTHELVQYDESSATVPRQTMQEFASAAFFEYSDLLPIPEDLDGSAITYDESLDSYILPTSDMGESYTRLEGYIVENGKITAKVGMYSFELGLTDIVSLTLSDNQYVSGITNPTYFYSVNSIAIEAINEKLWMPLDNDSISYTSDEGITVNVKITGDEEAYNSTIDFDINGKAEQHKLDYYFDFIQCHVSDADLGDGAFDLYISGSDGTAYRVTLIFRIDANGMSTNEIFGDVIALTSSGAALTDTYTDVLGTYGSRCLYTRTSNLTFECNNVFEIPAYEGFLYDRSLTLIRDGLEVLIEYADGSVEDATLNTGTKMSPFETDGETYCKLLLEDGSKIHVEIAPDTENWGWLINGVNEYDWFGEVPYAG